MFPEEELGSVFGVESTWHGRSPMSYTSALVLILDIVELEVLLLGVVEEEVDFEAELR